MQINTWGLVVRWDVNGCAWPLPYQKQNSAKAGFTLGGLATDKFPTFFRTDYF